MKKILFRVSAFTLAIVIICTVMPVRAADFGMPGSCLVQTDSGASGAVKTLDYDYSRNTYVSLRDMAMIFRDTEKAFSLEVAKNAVSLNTGGIYTPVGSENIPWEDGESRDVSLRRNEFQLDGQKVNYYTVIMELPSGGYDCFMMAADLAMILDVDITAPETGVFRVNLQEPFDISPAKLEQEGYFYGVNSVLTGDATTGEIYYRYQSDTAYPIASTSKLMTYLLTMEAVSAGQISLDTEITVSENVQLLAESDDGVISLEAGEQITVRDLLLGALLPSSNECALCLAEAVAGTEEAFVGMMNRKAQELGLSEAVFYNCNGLPCYTEGTVPAKRQNRMSAEDMFRLVSYLLKTYPQITDITSMESAVLESCDLEVQNTNPLLYNLPEATGLKTGTTDRSGACLVTSLNVDDGTAEHDLVVIVLGAENSVDRGRASELLARYAMRVFHGDTEKVEDGAAKQPSENLPVHAEAAVERILQTAKNCFD